jgi:hypothetical protein
MPDSHFGIEPEGTALFWLAPIVGAVAAGLFDRTFFAKTYPNR